MIIQFTAKSTFDMEVNFWFDITKHNLQIIQLGEGLTKLKWLEGKDIGEVEVYTDTIKFSN